jgi:hypothetical protein
MQIFANTPDHYVSHLPEDRIAPIEALREAIKNNLPPGFEETMSYGMIGYVVPHALYPAGYHCDPKLPLPFMSIASQKKFRGRLSHGHLRQPRTDGVVHSRVPPTRQRQIGHGQKLHPFQKARSDSFPTHRRTGLQNDGGRLGRAV